MLDSGTNEKGTFLALNGLGLRLKTEATIDGIRHFRQIAQQRWASKSASGLGSDSGQQLDLAFLTFSLSADNVESALQKIRAEDLQVFKLT
jgi:hypothetical protein